MCVSHLITPLPALGFFFPLIFANLLGKHGISLVLPCLWRPCFFEFAHSEEQQEEIDRGDTRYTGIIGFRVQNPAWGEVGEAEFGKESGCGGGEN